MRAHQRDACQRGAQPLRRHESAAAEDVPFAIEKRRRREPAEVVPFGNVGPAIGVDANRDESIVDLFRDR